MGGRLPSALASALNSAFSVAACCQPGPEDGQLWHGTWMIVKAGGEYSLLLVGLGQRTGDKMEGRIGVKRMFLEVRLGDVRVERRGSVEDRDVSEKTGKGVW